MQSRKYKTGGFSYAYENGLALVWRGQRSHQPERHQADPRRVAAVCDFKNLLTVIIQVVVGLGIYLTGSAILELDTFEYFKDVLAPSIRQKLKR